MKKNRSTRKKLSDQIREAVEKSGLSHHRIASETGLHDATLSRFMSGERGLTMKGLDQLADFLGLQIVIEARLHKKKGK